MQAHLLFRQRWQKIALVVLGIILLPMPAFAADGGERVIAENQVVSGDVSTISEPVVVRGEVMGDVTSWSGDITIDGKVDGDVVSYTGNVRIAGNGVVTGSVLSVAGKITRDGQQPRAEISMSQNAALASVMNTVMPPAALPSSSAHSIGRTLLGVMVSIFLLAFSLLWGAIWPNRTLAASLTLRRMPFHSLAVGYLATLVAILVVPPLAGLLAASLVGMPLLVVLVFAVGAPYVYGLAAMARALALSHGEPLRPMPLPAPSTLIFLVVVVAVLGVTCVFAPLTGLLLFYLLAAPGLGAVMLSRGGLVAPSESVS